MNPSVTPSADQPASSRHRPVKVLLWLLAGIVAALVSRWIGRAIPLDRPAWVRYPLSTGYLLGVFLAAAGLRRQLAALFAWLQQRCAPMRSTLVIAVLSCFIIGGIVTMKYTHLIRQDEPAGDEPEYLMLTRSLIDDGDYELEVDIATRVCSEFMNGRFQLSGRSIRPPGLPLILIPAFLAGRHLPWIGLPHAIYLFMGLLYIFLGAQLFLTLQAATARPRLAVAVTLTAMLTPPLLPYAFHVYPEIPAAGLLLCLFRREFYGDPDRNRLADGILLALIPFFHQKYMFLFAVSLLHLLTGLHARRRRTITSWIAVLLPSAVTLAYLSVFFGRRFGVWLPTAPYALNEGLLSNILTRQTLRSVLAQFFDRKWGLFAVNPLLLFAIPGIYAVWRRRPWMWLGWFALTGGFAVLVSAYPMWWGGFCPAGRFVLPVVPLMWVGIGHLFAFQRQRTSLTTVSCGLMLVLAGWFSALMLFGTPFKTQNVSPYQYPEESPNGSALWAAASTCVDWNGVLPAIERNGKWNHILPDALQFNDRDAWELAGYCLLVLTGSCLIIRSGRSASDRAADVSFLLIPALFLLSGFGFFFEEGEDRSFLVRQRFQRELAASPEFPPAVPAAGEWRSLPGAYGTEDGEWFRAPEPRFDIFYPPIYIQDMPDELWPGGFRYRFRVPVRWLPGSDGGRIGFSVENLLTRQKQVAETVWAAGAGAVELEVICPVDSGETAMFKIILYADTSQYEYRAIRAEADDRAGAGR